MLLLHVRHVIINAVKRSYMAAILLHVRRALTNTVKISISIEHMSSTLFYIVSEQKENLTLKTLFLSYFPQNHPLLDWHLLSWNRCRPQDAAPSTSTGLPKPSSKKISPTRLLWWDLICFLLKKKKSDFYVWSGYLDALQFFSGEIWSIYYLKIRFLHLIWLLQAEKLFLLMLIWLSMLLSGN